MKVMKEMQVMKELKEMNKNDVLTRWLPQCGILLRLSLLLWIPGCISPFPSLCTDYDGDGYHRSCSPDASFGEMESSACDGDAERNPGVPEVCDGVDNDCDDSIDEDVSQVFYWDRDGDGYGDGSESVVACEMPSGYVSDSSDCDDTNAAINPEGIEACNGKDDDCDGDLDNGQPSNTYFPDIDLDGYGDATKETTACQNPGGYVERSGDCDDTNAAINPDQIEVCNGIDDDCDDAIDEDVTQVFYWDRDGDDYGDVSEPVDACLAPSGYVPDSSDCDDTNAAVNPDQIEVCNEEDDDCDELTDEGVTQTFYSDRDGDGHGDESDPVDACDVSLEYVSNSSDCDDANQDIKPGAPEACNGLDDDCDGVRDDTLVSDPLNPPFWYDGDGDGFGGPVCALPEGANEASRRGDCDDLDGDVYPGSVVSGKDCCALDKVRCVRLGGASKSTLTDALNGIPAGSVIWVGPDSSSGALNVNAISSIPASNLSILSTDGHEATTLTPLNPGTRLLSTSAAGFVLDGFTIKGYGTTVESTGGLINVSGGDITMRRCILTGGKASLHGGALYAGSGSVHLTGVILYDNSASGYGGAICIGSSSVNLTVHGGWIDGNASTASSTGGGGIYSVGKTTLTNLRISNNIAYGPGGGISQSGGSVTLSNVVLTENNSGSPRGGAMSLLGTVNASLSHVAVVGNGAARAYDCYTSTGGIWIEGTSSKLTITNSIISQNYEGSTVSCGNGSCSVTSPGSTTGGMNLVGSGCTNKLTPPTNITLYSSDFYQVGASGSDLASYGISGGKGDSEWSTTNPMSYIDTTTLQKVDPLFVGWESQDFHLQSSSPLANTAACTSSACDPDGTAPDLGPYGGPGGALWDLDLDGTFEWWWYDSYDSRPSGVTGAWDSDDTSP